MAPVTRHTTSPAPRPRPARLRIFMPTLGLLLVMAGVGIVWGYLSWRASAELDAWLQREADLGRTWSCPDRSIGGFPFRIEVTCLQPTFTGVAEGQPISGRLGKIHTVAQIYNPGHVIVEVDGPLAVTTSAGDRLDAEWQLARASIHGRPGAGLDRLSAEVNVPRVTIAGPRGNLALTATLADFHIRRTPDRPAADGAYDIASRIVGATVPPLDALLGGTAPAQLDLVATITQAEPLAGRGLPSELERWRAAGGRLQISTGTLAHGTRRIDLSGNVGLDDAHRPQGRLDVTVSGLDDMLARFGLGGRGGALGGLIAGVLGGRPATGGAQAAEPAPGAAQAPKGMVLPLRMENGRASLGPLPLLALPPLY